MSVLMPEVKDTTITPTASAPEHITAIAASPFIFEFSPSRSSKNAAAIHTGIDTASGAALSAYAIASEAKPT